MMSQHPKWAWINTKTFPVDLGANFKIRYWNILQGWYQCYVLNFLFVFFYVFFFFLSLQHAQLYRTQGEELYAGDVSCCKMAASLRFQRRRFGWLDVRNQCGHHAAPTGWDGAPVGVGGGGAGCRIRRERLSHKWFVYDGKLISGKAVNLLINKSSFLWLSFGLTLKQSVFSTIFPKV